MSDQERGGEMSSPSQVYFLGILPKCENAEEVSVIAIADLLDGESAASASVPRHTIAVKTP